MLFAPAAVNPAALIPTDKAVITLTPKFGPVTFAHQRHTELDGVDCATCHHMMDPSSEDIRSCYDCHRANLFRIAEIRKADAEPEEDDGSGPVVPDAQAAFHGLCTGCHQHRRSETRPAGPDESCRDCHK